MKISIQDFNQKFGDKKWNFRKLQSLEFMIIYMIQENC